MRLFILLVILGLSIGDCVAENPGPQNPFGKNLNSCPLYEKEYDGFSIQCGYYYTFGNIDDSTSSFFKQKEPTNEQIIDFAKRIPPYFWAIQQGDSLVKIVGIYPESRNGKRTWVWHIVDMVNHTQKVFPTNLHGDIAEHRYLELKPNATEDDYRFENLMDPDKKLLVTLGKVPVVLLPYRRIYGTLEVAVQKHKLYLPETDISKVESLE